MQGLPWTEPYDTCIYVMLKKEHMCPGLGLVLLLKAFGWQSIRINIKEPPCVSCDCCLSTAATMMRVKSRWALSGSVFRRVSWWQRDTMIRYIHCVAYCLPDMVTRKYSYFFLKPIVAPVSSIHSPRYWEGGRILLKGTSLLIPRTSVTILHLCLDNAKEEIMIDARF